MARTDELQVSLGECDVALACLKRAKAELPRAEFGEGDIALAYDTARGAVILAMSHVIECKKQWSAQSGKE